MSKASQICRDIQIDIDKGKFEAKNNDELFTAYYPLAKLSNDHEENNSTVGALSLIEDYLKTLTMRDKVLLPCLKLFKSYGKPIKTHKVTFNRIPI